MKFSINFRRINYEKKHTHKDITFSRLGCSLQQLTLYCNQRTKKLHEFSSNSQSTMVGYFGQVILPSFKLECRSYVYGKQDSKICHRVY